PYYFQSAGLLRALHVANSTLSPFFSAANCKERIGSLLCTCLFCAWYSRLSCNKCQLMLMQQSTFRDASATWFRIYSPIHLPQPSLGHSYPMLVQMIEQRLDIL